MPRNRRSLHILANIQGMFFNQHIKNIARLQFLLLFCFFFFQQFLAIRLVSTRLDSNRIESHRIAANSLDLFNCILIYLNYFRWH